jgi:hypothetical protein
MTTSKTVARDAQRNRRRELEGGGQWHPARRASLAVLYSCGKVACGGQGQAGRVGRKYSDAAQPVSITPKAILRRQADLQY